MEAAVSRSCAIFLAQNIWLDGFCSVVFYHEFFFFLFLSQKEEEHVLLTKLVLERKRLKFSKVIVLG